MFWLPQLIRADLETQFKSIRNLSAFRDFIGGTLGDYLFQEQRIVDENETVDSNYLKTFNMTLKSAPSQGRLILGAMRFQQIRVKHYPCKR